MNDIRAKFEEIWPVPEGVKWSINVHSYVCTDVVRMTQEGINKCVEWDARLDTFTRCQETMAPAMSIIEEMIADLERIDADYGILFSVDLIFRAKKILGRDK